MKQWAILVGLNRYEFFQPLGCAQQDAQSLHQLLIHQVGLPAEQCLLMTDLSSPVQGRPTQPTRANLHAWIDHFAQRYWQPGDSLLFFFSGHGMYHHGEDYLVPLDGSPSYVGVTCLSVADLLNRFRAALPIGDITVFLDISRSQATPAYSPSATAFYSAVPTATIAAQATAQATVVHSTVGIQTAQLAHQLGMPTLLSCQPGQFSREVSSLGHGLFTQGILEAFQYQPDINLSALTHYLSDRLPELSEYYWLPSQKPVLICPPEKLYHPLLILPHLANGVGSNSFAGNGYATSSSVASTAPSFSVSPTIPQPTSSTAGLHRERVQPAASSATTLALQQSGFYSPGSLQEEPPSPSAVHNDDRKLAASLPVTQLSRPQATSSPQATDSPITNGSTRIGVSYPGEANGNGINGNGVRSQNGNGLVSPPLHPEVAGPTNYPVNPSSVSAETIAPPMGDAPTVLDPVEGTVLRPIVFWGGLLALGLVGCVLWRNWAALWFPNLAIAPNPSTELGFPNSLSRSASSNPANSAASAPSSTPSNQVPSNQVPSKQVPASVGASGVISTAMPPSTTADNQALNFNPTGTPQRSDSPDSVAAIAPQTIPTSASQPSGQAILDKARAMVLSNQATPYRDAVQEAKKITQADVVYAEAQQDIARWNQTIWTLAQTRANQGRWDIAIMAADLVPADNPTLRSQANAAITQWCPAMLKAANFSDTYAQQKAREICGR